MDDIFEAALSLRNNLNDGISRSRSEQKTPFNQKQITELNLTDIGKFSDSLLLEMSKALNTIGCSLNHLQNNIKVKTNNEQFNMIKTALEDIFLLTHKLKLFSSPCVKTEFTQTVDIKSCVVRQVRSFEHTLHQNIDLELYVEQELHTIKGSFALIKMMIANLLYNAQEAIEAIGGAGSIKIHIQNFSTCDQLYDFEGKKLPKQGVMIQVCDNGVGMDQEQLQDIFKPFYSRKTEHSGLGLAMVYGVLKSHGGNILVYSAANHGTHIDIFLPTDTINCD